MTDFTMPALGADMETGRVVEWRVQAGDRVKPGDVVVVVETHKGAIDVECFLDGVIDHLAPLETELPVGAVLATVDAVGAATPTATAPTPVRATAAAPAPLHAPAPAWASAPATAPPPTPPPAPPPPPRRLPAQPATLARRQVSPAARRRAAVLGLDVDRLPGSGTANVVTLADVVRAAAAPQAAPRQAPLPAPTAAGAPVRNGFDPALMRQAIAVAMARSKREIPHYYLTSTIDFGAASAWLEAYNRDQPVADRLLPATLLLKASARALAALPQFNGFHDGQGFRPGAGVHVGWAIALRGGGLVAPAIHDADRLPLPALMRTLRALVQRARTGRLRSSELIDPTVTVTNLGDRGAESVLGVIHPPQVAIIGFGRIADRPWVHAGQLAVRPLVAATLAADHRTSDGHLGSQLLAAIDQALQAPDTL